MLLRLSCAAARPAQQQLRDNVVLKLINCNDYEDGLTKRIGSSQLAVWLTEANGTDNELLCNFGRAFYYFLIRNSSDGNGISDLKVNRFFYE